MVYVPEPPLTVALTLNGPLNGHALVGTVMLWTSGSAFTVTDWLAVAEQPLLPVTDTV